jgi:WD40 repeat protein
MLPSKFRRILALLVTVGPLAICALGSQGESAIAQESKLPAVLALRSAEREEQADNIDEAERPRNLVRHRIFNKKPPKPWAIILCKFSDLATFEPYPVDYYEQCFTEFGAGTGREFDYFREVTYGALDLTGTRVFGWFNMPHHSSKDPDTLKYPSGRATLHDWGVEVAKAHRIDLRPFHGVAVFFNAHTDSGATGRHRVVIGYKKQDWEPTFNLHEFGHGFDLGHSWSARPDVEYGDRWDLMSAMRVYTFTDRFGRRTGPGLNACNLHQLGCIPRNRIWSPTGHSGIQTFTLAALNRPEANRYLMASIPPAAGSTSKTSYVIEFRQKKGWDAGIPRNTVLVHEVRSNGGDFLLAKNEGADTDSTKASVRPPAKRNPDQYEVLPGDEFTIPARHLTVRVLSFDPAASTAEISIAFGATSHRPLDIRSLACVDQEQNRQAHIWDVKFSSDGRLLLGAGDAGPSGGIHIWDVATSQERPTLLTGEKVWFSNAVFTPDAKEVVSCYSRDNRVFTWDVATGKAHRRLSGHTKPVTNVAISPDGRLAVSGGRDKTLFLWDLENGQELHRFPVNFEKCSGAFSPDNKFILTYGDDPTLRTWDVESGAPVHELVGHSAGCSGFFSHDGRQILSFSSDKTVRLWDAAGKQIRLFEGCADVVLGAAFLPRDGQVIAWGKDHMLRIWDAGSGREVRMLDLGEDWKLDAASLALDPHRRRLLTSHQDQSVRLRDLSTGKELRRYTNVRNSRGLTFSPDGRFAASGSFRAGVYVLRLPE